MSSLALLHVYVQKLVNIKQYYILMTSFSRRTCQSHTSRTAVAIPSLVELFTTAKQVWIAAWRSHVCNDGNTMTPGNLKDIQTDQIDFSFTIFTFLSWCSTHYQLFLTLTNCIFSKIEQTLNLRMVPTYVWSHMLCTSRKAQFKMKAKFFYCAQISLMNLYLNQEHQNSSIPLINH